MPEPSKAHDGLTGLYAELGPPEISLRIHYKPHNGDWRRIQQTYSDGSPAGEKVDHLVHDPAHDLITQVGSWGGPVTIEMTGMDPHELLKILKPALHQVTVQINGQTFTE